MVHFVSVNVNSLLNVTYLFEAYDEIGVIVIGADRSF